MSPDLRYGSTQEPILPCIKDFLYSDHQINLLVGISYGKYCLITKSHNLSRTQGQLINFCLNKLDAAIVLVNLQALEVSLFELSRQIQILLCLKPDDISCQWGPFQG